MLARGLMLWTAILRVVNGPSARVGGHQGECWPVSLVVYGSAKSLLATSLLLSTSDLLLLGIPVNRLDLSDYLKSLVLAAPRHLSHVLLSENATL